jgi:hypothetical protein
MGILKKAKKGAKKGLLFNLDHFKKRKKEQKEEKKANIMLQGVDTLYIGWLVDIDKETLDILADLKEKARDLGKPQNVGKFGDYYFNIRGNGAQRYSYILENDLMQIKVNKMPVGGTYPNVRVEFRSSYLWDNGPDYCHNEVRAIIDSYLGEIIEEKISRVDFCVDVMGLHDFFQNYDRLKRKVISKARTRKVVETNKDINALTIGSRKSKIYARIYDKSLEIKQTKKKMWFYDLWQLSEGIIKLSQLLGAFFQDCNKRFIFSTYIFDLMEKAVLENVWRVEFELKREILKEFRVKTYQDLKAYAGDMWNYLTGDWLSIRKEDNENISRRSVFKFWEKIHKIKDLDKPGLELLKMTKIISNRSNQLIIPFLQMVKGFNLENSRLLSMSFFGLEQGIEREKQASAKVSQLLASAGGYISSVATMLGIDDLDKALRFCLGFIKDNTSFEDFKEDIRQKIPKYQFMKKSADNVFYKLKAQAI